MLVMPINRPMEDPPRTLGSGTSLLTDPKRYTSLFSSSRDCSVNCSVSTGRPLQLQVTSKFSLSALGPSDPVDAVDGVYLHTPAHLKLSRAVAH